MREGRFLLIGCGWVRLTTLTCLWKRARLKILAIIVRHITLPIAVKRDWVHYIATSSNKGGSLMPGKRVILIYNIAVAMRKESLTTLIWLWQKTRLTTLSLKEGDADNICHSHEGGRLTTLAMIKREGRLTTTVAVREGDAHIVGRGQEEGWGSQHEGEKTVPALAVAMRKSDAPKVLTVAMRKGEAHSCACQGEAGMC